MLDRITPIILTYNEAPNIGRTLGMLRWATDIVVVDSGSTDKTCEIVAEFPHARVFRRPFTTHAEQWNFGLEETDIRTDWVLVLDADYVLSERFVQELTEIESRSEIAGFRARFRYCVEGKPLRGALYPPVVVLFRRAGARYAQDGHTQRLQIAGTIGELEFSIFHDDRKSLSRWVASQNRYMRLEAEKLINADSLSLNWSGRIRKLRVVAPFAMLFYCLFVKGLVLDGRAGLFYSFQRVFAELLLSLHLLRHDLSSDDNATD